MKKKIVSLITALYCAMSMSAQSFLGANEMLKMMGKEYAVACYAMGKMPGYKQKGLAAGTAFYKNCTIEVMSIASNPNQSWPVVSNAKEGLSTCVAIYYLPGDMDVYRVEAIVYGKKAAQLWVSQLQKMGFKTTEAYSLGYSKEWHYKKSGEECTFTLHYVHDKNEYTLTVFNPYYLY